MEEVQKKVSSGLSYYRKTIQRRLVDNVQKELVEYLRPFVTRDTTILDVGSGPITRIGTLLNGQPIKVTACDKYADEYLSMANYTPNAKLEYQDMEHLTYPSNSFDIVHCENAIDHTKRADRALSELMRVASKLVILLTAPNQRTRFGGNHYWDAYLEDGITKLKCGRKIITINAPSKMLGDFIYTEIWISQ